MRGRGSVSEFFFQGVDGKRDNELWREFRRVLFRSEIGKEKGIFGNYGNENVIVVYKKSKELNGKTYIVEIKKSIIDDNDQSVVAHSLFDEEKYSISIPANIYGDVKTEFENIVRNLRLRNNRLAIVTERRSKSLLNHGRRNIQLKTRPIPTNKSVLVF